MNLWEEYTMLENLGNKLKITRINNNLTRKQVAELVGVSVSTIGFYENNERLPSIDTLAKLASIYKVSMEYLLDLNTNDPKTMSLEGLSEEQIKILKLTADCFRKSK